MFFSIFEPFFRPFIRLSTAWKRFNTYLFEVNRYYQNSLFQSLDTKLQGKSSLDSAFKIVKQHAKMDPNNPNKYIYGETPLAVYEFLADTLTFNSQTKFLELGFGRGRGLFFLKAFYECQLYGLEQTLEFFQEAKKLSEYKRLGIELFHGDYLQDKLPEVDVVYCYASTMKLADIDKLCQQIKQYMNDPIVVTPSFSLSSYDQDFELITCHEQEYEIGTLTLYFCRLSNFSLKK